MEPQMPQQTVTPSGFQPEEHFVAEPPRVYYSSPANGTTYETDTLVLRNRQPNLGYAALLLAIGGLVLILVSVAVGVFSALTHNQISATSKSVPLLSIMMEALTFSITYGIAYQVFPRMWRRRFGEVIEWNPQAAKQHILPLIATGAALSIVAQALESLLTLPKEMPVDAFFKQPSTLWIIAVFGTFVAPVCEEVFFRGFLLRGFAIFFDWIAVPKNDEGRRWWQTTDHLTERSLVLSGILTSGLFAAMHAAQLGWAWNAVGVLWVVGGALTWVRLRYNSVAASSLVHAAYNGLLFVLMFFVTDGFRHLDKLSNH